MYILSIVANSIWLKKYEAIKIIFIRIDSLTRKTFSLEIILGRGLMNTQLIDSLARIILSLSEEERELLNRKIESEQRENWQINAQILDLETRVKQ